MDFDIDSKSFRFRSNRLHHDRGRRKPGADVQILQRNDGNHRGRKVQISHGRRNQFHNAMHKKDQTQRRGKVQGRREQRSRRRFRRNATLRFG